MELSKEQQEDVVKRTEDFMVEYKALIAKHEVELGSWPVPVSFPNGVFANKIEMGPVDTKYIPKPSPISDSVMEGKK